MISFVIVAASKEEEVSQEILQQLNKTALWIFTPVYTWNETLPVPKQ